MVPIYIERQNKINFKLTVFKPFKFQKNDGVEKITQDLNTWLENAIKIAPSKWIWTHDRWK